jgi:hypothetical protein
MFDEHVQRICTEEGEIENEDDMATLFDEASDENEALLMRGSRFQNHE